MYKISIKNLGSNSVTKDVTLHTDDRHQAIALAFTECKAILGGLDNIALEVVGEEVNVKKDAVLVGSFSVTKLN